MKKFFIAFFSCLALLSADVKAQKNLLYNGGFENELEGWNAGNAKTTPWVHKFGKSALAITSFNKDKWEGIDQSVNLPKNTKAIKVSAWAKTDDVVQGKDSWNVALIIVEFANGSKKIGEGINILSQAGTNEWAEHIKAIKVPDEARNVRVMVALGNASGTFFVDDLSVKVISVEDFDKESASTKSN